MEFHLLPTIALLFLILNGSNGALPGEVYWKSKLPNTPFPKALHQLLPPQGQAAITSNFAEYEHGASGSVIIYNVAYWSELSKAFDNNNDIYNATTAVFFSYNDLHFNKKMKLIFTKSQSTSKFLSREVANSIPFSSKKLKEILDYFSIQPTSKEAQAVKQTIEECEAPGIRGEDKYCATSFESLVDHVVSKYGEKVQTLSNEVEEENKKQEYTILKGIKMMGENQMVCHKQMFIYAVFYCHIISDTKAYTVPMVGADGSEAKAAVVCHFDTSDWNPKHVAFQALGLKPGGPPICHFHSSDTIVWVGS